MARAARLVERIGSASVAQDTPPWEPETEFLSTLRNLPKRQRAAAALHYVGDLSVPASLVNEVLQKKLAEQRDQLKLPNNVKDIKVENGELVFVEK